MTPSTAATTKTLRITSAEFSWERAKARSVDGVSEDTACSNYKANRSGYEALIEKIILRQLTRINTVMNSADKKLSRSEELEFVWTFPAPAPRIEADIGKES